MLEHFEKLAEVKGRLESSRGLNVVLCVLYAVLGACIHSLILAALAVLSAGIATVIHLIALPKVDSALGRLRSDLGRS